MEVRKPNPDFVQTITLNTQKGEFYKVKLENDDNIYEGIPMICANCQGDEPQFTMKITDPPEAANRTITDYISKIEQLVEARPK
jgi:hypothetical protein